MTLKTDVYLSNDGQVRLTIKTVDAATGALTGSLTVLNTPIGAVTYDDEHGFWGRWHWTKNQQTIALEIVARIRPVSWDYIINDMWAGCADDNFTEIVMGGTRAYTEGTGLKSLESFVNVRFTLQ